MRSFHFFTLVTRDDQYDEMRASLERVGFDAENSVFTVLDNRKGNAHEPYSGINEAMRMAQAPYVLFCHQDLVFQNGPEDLLAALQEIEARDASWAVAGNAGMTPTMEGVLYLDDHAGHHEEGVAPARVSTLDENFLVIRRDSGVGCSPELSGFHLYATDLCLNAYLKGRSAWVIKYRLTHNSSTLDYAGLHVLARSFWKVWRKRIRGALLVTPSAMIVFSRVPFLFTAVNRVGIYPKLIGRFTLLNTLDYLLRHGRPDWLPTGDYAEAEWRRPRLSPAVLAFDRLLRLGRKDGP